MILKSIKIFLVFSFLYFPFFVMAEVSCLPSSTSTIIGQDISWSIYGIGEQIPYFISWSGDGMANNHEDSLVYSNKYDTTGLKSVRVFFGLEGVEPTYDIVCEPVLILDENSVMEISTTTSTTTIPIVKKKRSYRAVQSFSDESNNTLFILSTSTVDINISTSTEINLIDETEKKILPQKIFIFSKKLWIGLEEEEVKELQTKLLQLGFFNAEITGFFGFVTQKAVVDFQKYHNIEPSLGFVGPLTRSVLNKL